MLAGNIISGYALFKSLSTDKVAVNTARFAKSATVEKEIEYFRERVGNMATPEDFLKDYRLLKFVLTAYDMEDQLEYPARIKQILRDDPSNSNALVNRMTNAGYRTINADFSFFSKGTEKLKDTSFIDGVIEKYKNARYEISLGELNPAVSDAMYFQRKISSVKNGYEIIGDPVLFDVALTALNLPRSAAATKVERLKVTIESKLDMEKLSDATYTRKLVERYLVLKDVQNMQSQSDGLLGMFA
ncbi:DUF1217 domain-containing protein [Rhabdaerophilum sp. SD176]|jgi:hypothetical protein|uniref:DUF1217 domain-containing protein n=1 Tax=Rhabdaerophilum sp. SD176 TaxID=2983548 RepID=UPI0024DFD197|nr:DUF1217 domain-containing protein [Rhabdaerophilum sp. SD176]